MLSPFLVRIADQAAGLITRKAITLKMENPEEEVDEYWESFIEDVDGFGTDITSFARRTVLSSLLLGHAATMVDFPSTEPAPNLQVERELGLRPYWIPCGGPDSGVEKGRRQPHLSGRADPHQ